MICAHVYFHFFILNYHNYAFIKNHIFYVCSQNAFVRMRCVCTCDVQRVVMCAFEAIAHICMYAMASMCIICAVLFCSYFISLGSAPDPSSGDGRKDPAGGVVYVRWGRKSCPGNATLVYSGNQYITPYNIEPIMRTFNNTLCDLPVFM